ncbi:MAG: hypothetical protein MUD14_01230 [Hydrococcus sp. Prado102]|nr:hypothetical protein [Hydrococcus sp. Prado102]
MSSAFSQQLSIYCKLLMPEVIWLERRDNLNYHSIMQLTLLGKAEKILQEVRSRSQNSYI